MTEFIERSWCTKCQYIGQFYDRVPCPKCSWDPIGSGSGIWGGHLTLRFRWVSTVVWWKPATWFSGYWEDELAKKIDPQRFVK